MTTREYFQTAYTGSDPQQRSRYNRAGNALYRAGVETMSQLCAMREEDIRGIRYIGAQTMPIIMEECGKYRKLPPALSQPIAQLESPRHSAPPPFDKGGESVR